ncbi:MAG: DUF2269 family protein [Deltaproteobacteria bacterium]|nr:DUF2269 family protein [Deltaproteobacteria bacterium]MBW2393741.1 DUF2269 family protein [Deltaproteobacteria bacterium]
MSFYLLLKTLHLAAACIYLGVSVSNGYAKTRADRRRDPRASALALDFVVGQNRVFLLPASALLLATGLAMAYVTGLPWMRGWLSGALILFAALSLLLGLAIRLEDRLLVLAEDAEREQSTLPDAYWRLSRRWSALGGIATLGILLMLATMVGRMSLIGG